MNQTNLFKTALLGVATLLLAPQNNLSAQPRSVTSSGAKPNIIFILADDQGWNGTSVQMHPDMANSKSDFYRTPNIGKLAGRGMKFSHAYSPGPMCSPTRASLQTGKSPAQLRMTNVGRGRPATPWQRLILPPHSSALSTEETTIGEILKSAGYARHGLGSGTLAATVPGLTGMTKVTAPRAMPMARPAARRTSSPRSRNSARPPSSPTKTPPLTVALLLMMLMVRMMMFL